MKFSIRPAWFRSNRMYIRSICICILSLTGYGRLAAQHPLSKKNAALLAEQFLQRKKQIQKPHADSVWNGKEIVNGQYRMPFTCTEFGDAPKNGHSLYISLHGGGNVPAEDNDQQWRNQQRLYKVKEGLYVAPRAPTNTWNLWHEAHIGPMLDDLIGALIVSRGVDPDKVYITGYSAGGDGVYQLATRMADRWAAAGMMAGHPGDADIRNLRNLPFALFVGGLDSAYNRNGLGEWWGHQLDSLQHVDTTGFIHLVRVYPDKAHWMDRRDTLGVEWMAQFNRKTLPAKVVWVMDDQFESSCYWLATDTSNCTTGSTAIAEIEGNIINIRENTFNKLVIGLNDQLIDLDKPVEIKYKGKKDIHGDGQALRKNDQPDFLQGMGHLPHFFCKVYLTGETVTTTNIPVQAAGHKLL